MLSVVSVTEIFIPQSSIGVLLEVVFCPNKNSFLSVLRPSHPRTSVEILQKFKKLSLVVL